jgi:hypothetical protein
LLHEGNDYTIVQKALGHNDIQSTKSYARADVEQLRDIAIPVPAPGGVFADFLKMPADFKQNTISVSLLVKENESYEGVAK